MFDRSNPPPPAAPAPDPAKALTKVLEAQRKKAEQAAAKQAEAERIAELARLAYEDHGKRNSAKPFGSPAARGVNPVRPGDLTADAREAGRTSLGPAQPRGFLSDSLSDSLDD